MYVISFLISLSEKSILFYVCLLCFQSIKAILIFDCCLNIKNPTFCIRLFFYSSVCMNENQTASKYGCSNFQNRYFNMYKNIKSRTFVLFK